MHVQVNADIIKTPEEYLNPSRRASPISNDTTIVFSADSSQLPYSTADNNNNRLYSHNFSETSFTRCETIFQLPIYK